MGESPRAGKFDEGDRYNPVKDSRAGFGTGGWNALRRSPQSWNIEMMMVGVVVHRVVQVGIPGMAVGRGLGLVPLPGGPVHDPGSLRRREFIRSS
jgi:hypothetical protein